MEENAATNGAAAVENILLGEYVHQELRKEEFFSSHIHFLFSFSKSIECNEKSGQWGPLITPDNPCLFDIPCETPTPKPDPDPEPEPETEESEESSEEPENPE